MYTKIKRKVQFPKKDHGSFWLLNQYTLLGTNISPQNGILKMIFLFPRWDMLVPWRVIQMRFAPIPFFQTCILLSSAVLITKNNPASHGHMADLTVTYRLYYLKE